MIRYRRQLIRYGAAAEVYIFPVAESGRSGKGSRGRRRKPSRACQERLNNIHRAQRLTREIGHNFRAGAPVLALSYAGGAPESYEEAQKYIAAYLGKIRRAAAGEISYIYVTEQGSRRGRWHHHMILDAPGVDWETLNKKWGRGRVDISGLYFDDEGTAAGLARYFCKGDGGHMTGGRIHRSRNIKQPGILSNDFEISRRAAGRIAGAALQGEELGEVKLLAGYTVTSSGTFYNDINGGYYIRIFLKRRGGAENVQIQGGGRKTDTGRPGRAEKIRDGSKKTEGGRPGGVSPGGGGKSRGDR